MGLFQQKPQEPSAWAALPGEPVDETGGTERLDEVPAMDLMDIGLGAQYSTTVIPVTPPAPEAADTAENDGE
ncbi:hypothetical protein [Microbacterium alcoholitolerans]|uniref:hypothetical protein n=1 Tax=unclassified Microbacterium TaxID=2609290 RepID=UPI003D16EB14